MKWKWLIFSVSSYSFFLSSFFLSIINNKHFTLHRIRFDSRILQYSIPFLDNYEWIHGWLVVLNLDHESFEIVSNHRKYTSKLLNMTNDNKDRFLLLYYLLEVSRLEDNRDPSSISSTIPNVLCFVSKTDRSTGRSSREKTNGCFLCCLLVTFFVALFVPPLYPTEVSTIHFLSP